MLKLKIPVFCYNKQTNDKIQKQIEDAERAERTELSLDLNPKDLSVRDMVLYGDVIQNLIILPYSFDDINFDYSQVLIRGMENTTGQLSPESVESLEKLIDSLNIK